MAVLQVQLSRAAADAPVTSTNAVTCSGSSPAVDGDFSGGALPSGSIAFAAGEFFKALPLDIAEDAVVGHPLG